MDDKVQDMIIDAVHADYEWKKEDVRVDEVERLRRGPCAFYTAAHQVRPLSYQPNYAVISGNTVVSPDENGISKILDACGGDAPADWWAEIVTRFHPDLGSGVVLIDKDQNTAAVQKILDAEKEFNPPELTDESGGKTVTFYMLDPESFVVYGVKAHRDKDGKVTVEQDELG